MRTFADHYCARHFCAPRRFQGQIFWRTLPWHALPIAPLLLLSDHFEPDRQLIAICAEATRLDQVTEAIRDHRYHPRNKGWMRTHAKVRISRGRLLALAESCLAPTGPVGQIGQVG